MYAILVGLLQLCVLFYWGLHGMVLHACRTSLSNNSVVKGVFSMLKLFANVQVHERYDIAWKDVRYGRVWEFLRAELEMEPRFETLDMKLNLIQDNLKYFLEILQARKSDFLEWTIIVLIAVEICLSLYELGSRGLFGA
jgi:uncharacterized Rmd1/YagE family protein